MSERTKQANIRLTEPEFRRYSADAESLGLTLSEYVRHCLQEVSGKLCNSCGGTGRKP